MLPLTPGDHRERQWKATSFAFLRDLRHPDQHLRHVWLSDRAVDEPRTRTPEPSALPRAVASLHTDTSNTPGTAT